MSGIFNQSGGYRKLYSFNFATIIHLDTVSFCKRFIDWKQDPLGKTLGQMMGASRSGKQLQSQEAAFLQSGGIRERMTQARAAARDPAAPDCLDCGKPMRRRTSRKGDFWGCSGYPDCRAIRDIGKEERTRD